jgi:hypothetical protein
VNLPRFMLWHEDDLVTANWLLKDSAATKWSHHNLSFVMRSLLRCNEMAGGSSCRPEARAAVVLLPAQPPNKKTARRRSVASYR